MVDREANGRLALLHREAGWTLRQFAQLVNRIATERGTPSSYRASSVHQWLQGHVPRAEARHLVREALSRRLGRPITDREVGFPPVDAAADPGLSERIAGLGESDMSPSRRGVLNASLFSVALTIPGWPDVVGRMERVRHQVAPRMGMPDVDMVIAMTERISELDDQFGGRHARPMAAAFLVNTVVPYLRAQAPDAVRKAMMAAASDLCYLTGYMAVDEGLEGLGQRYYLKALELAGASEDHLTYCTTLRGMSVQAVELGHGPTSRRLADAAASASPQAGPRMRAFLAGQQAHAAAQCGDASRAMLHLKEAEQAMDRAESRQTTFGSYDPAALYYHIGHTRHELGDVRGAISALEESDRLTYSIYRRGRLKKRATLAEYQLQHGHLEAACATWNQVLDELPLVQSGRVDRRVKQMFGLLKPHLGNRHARALYERARTETPTALHA
ncbi:tetratricopeptide repeat protein [Streptomyces sp. NPDC005955]|uniref:tetratricopeptide repeat protein n=1 Tax=Streptomyces sp. NPDC005955 TaxID=3364738 RepID=UPI0036D0A66C